MTTSESAFAAGDSALARILRGHPNLGVLVSAVLEYWPAHEAFLSRSLEAHDRDSLESVDAAAAFVVRLIGTDMPTFCEHYKWMCDVFNKEALHFVRTGEYRCKTFAEADEAVYSNKTFMEKYMDGLLVSQPLWFNHARSFYAFRRRFLPMLPAGADYLEIGPGHGLFLAQAAAEPAIATVTAWDVSDESLRQTARALARFGVGRAVELTQRDVMTATSADSYDAIVISEVLEHLEEPKRALESLGRHLREDGRIFVNVPINSPAPDHIFLLRTVDEAAALVQSAGLRIVDSTAEPMSGYTLDQAMAVKGTVTCLFVAQHDR